MNPGVIAGHHSPRSGPEAQQIALHLLVHGLFGGAGEGVAAQELLPAATRVAVTTTTARGDCEVEILVVAGSEVILEGGEGNLNHFEEVARVHIRPPPAHVAHIAARMVCRCVPGRVALRDLGGRHE